MSSKARRNQKSLKKSFIDFAFNTDNEEVFYLRFRKLLEQAIYSYLKEDFIQGELGPNLSRCLKKKPDFSKKNSIRKALKMANMQLHFEKSGQESNINKQIFINSLGAFLVEFNKVELSHELTNINLAVDVETETKSIASVDIGLEKGKTIIGHWRVIVESKKDEEIEVSVLEPQDIEGTYKFIIDEWQGQYLGDSSKIHYSNTPLRKTFKIVEVGDICIAHFMHVRAERVIAPSHLVLHPDYLMSASSISESATLSYDSTHYAEKHFLFKQFEIPKNQYYFFRGNVVNTLFDTLLFEDDGNFKTGLRKSWKEMPLEFYRFADETEEFSVNQVLNEVDEVYGPGLLAAKKEIRSLTQTEDRLEILEESEPSFIQPAYGLSGRLDYLKASFNRAIPQNLHIVELKSGKFWKTAKPGHLNQLAYYDLLLRNVNTKNGQKRITGLRKILYPDALMKSSSVLHGFEKKNGDNTADHGFIPFRKTQEIINGRNVIVQMLYKLSRATTLEDFENLFMAYLNLVEVNGLAKFEAEKFLQLKRHILDLSPVERSYFLSLLHFGLRDNLNQAIGVSGSRDSHGSSGLWRADQVSFDTINRVGNLSVKMLPKDTKTFQRVVFLRNGALSNQDNFKVGNAVQIREEGGNKLLKWMCIPGAIESISFNEIVVKLRFEQKYENSRLYSPDNKWVIEDLYINNLNRVFNGVKHFLDLPSEKRALCIGQAPPKIPAGFNDELDTIESAIIAKDYFIVNGVPGSGKSSRVIKSLVEHYSSKQKRVLLLTYTHKAADRLCEVVSQVQINNKPIRFVRSTSKDKAANEWKDICVDHLAGEGLPEDRKRLKRALVAHTVRIGSVLSYKVNDAWSSLIEYDCVIVDEASQVLESDLIHIVGNSKKFVLVGDVNQLPAITSVSSEEELIPSTLQNNLGIKSFSSSYFERMYHLAMRNGWTHAFGNLTTQGRMHEKIMDLANLLFYDNEMEVVDPDVQCAPIETIKNPENEIEGYLAKQNALFFNCLGEENNSKSSEKEANLVVDIIEGLVRLYSPDNKTVFIKNFIGVITPFRAQKALVSNLLQKRLSISNEDLPLVDTVESFQGSQRRYIIYTTAIGIVEQLDNISSISEESGVDRKLDVVITRAEQQLIIVGNSEVLQYAEQYKTLIEYLEKKDSLIDLSGNKTRVIWTNSNKKKELLKELSDLQSKELNLFAKSLADIQDMLSKQYNRLDIEECLYDLWVDDLNEERYR